MGGGRWFFSRGSTWPFSVGLSSGTLSSWLRSPMTRTSRFPCLVSTPAVLSLLVRDLLSVVWRFLRAGPLRCSQALYERDQWSSQWRGGAGGGSPCLRLESERGWVHLRRPTQECWGQAWALVCSWQDCSFQALSCDCNILCQVESLKQLPRNNEE